MRDYVIYAPEYAKSAGVRSLYSLSVELERKGYNAPVLTSVPHKDFHCIDYFCTSMQRNNIIVYPEIYIGNPFKFFRVARYILYYPGKLGGDRVFNRSELLFTWDKIYYPDVPELKFDLIDRNLFFDAHLPKTQDCVFIYKNNVWKKVPELETLTKITMDWPETREELARLLQTTRTLYSYDAHSAILGEACLCGAQVKIITHTGFNDLTFKDDFDHALHERQLDAFIELTQNM